MLRHSSPHAGGHCLDGFRPGEWYNTLAGIYLGQNLSLQFMAGEEKAWVSRGWCVAYCTGHLPRCQNNESSLCLYLLSRVFSPLHQR